MQMQQQQQMRLQPGASVYTGWQAGSANGETVLVISDMQTGFKEASGERVLENVCRLIDQAKARNWVIALIEYVGNGETLLAVRKGLEGYGRLIQVPKHQTNDGSHAVLAKLRDQQLRVNRYVVCGVSINACVRETSSGLAFSNGHPAVDVIASACADHHVEKRWDEYPEASQLRILPELQ